MPFVYILTDRELQRIIGKDSVLKCIIVCAFLVAGGTYGVTPEFSHYGIFKTAAPAAAIAVYRRYMGNIKSITIVLKGIFVVIGWLAHINKCRW